MGDVATEREPVSNVEALRHQAGMTQRQLAIAIDVTESTVRNWEKGRSGVELFVRLAALCDALNCKPGDLFRYDDNDA